MRTAGQIGGGGAEPSKKKELKRVDKGWPDLIEISFAGRDRRNRPAFFVLKMGRGTRAVL